MNLGKDLNRDAVHNIVTAIIDCGIVYRYKNEPDTFYVGIALTEESTHNERAIFYIKLEHVDGKFGIVDTFDGNDDKAIPFNVVSTLKAMHSLNPKDKLQMLFNVIGNL